MREVTIEHTCQDCEHRLEYLLFTRRQFLSRLGMGFGALSLTGLVGMGLLDPPDSAGDSFSPFPPKLPQFTPKAKRDLHIFRSSAPSHLDAWDAQPSLAQFVRKPLS